MKPRPVKAPCPICGGKGVRTASKWTGKPLRVLDAVCSACGWYFTSWSHVIKRRAAAREKGER